MHVLNILGPNWNRGDFAWTQELSDACAIFRALLSMKCSLWQYLAGAPLMEGFFFGALVDRVGRKRQQHCGTLTREDRCGPFQHATEDFCSTEYLPLVPCASCENDWH